MNIQHWKDQFKFVRYDDSFTVCFSRLMGDCGSVIKAGCFSGPGFVDLFYRF